jgi:U6 snRNA-associated Sm-like protein LSm1
MSTLPSWVSALASLVDKPILLILRDARILSGEFRSYDQFNNILIENCDELKIHHNEFGRIQLGTMIVRGENIVFFGEIDESEFHSEMKEVEIGEILEYSDLENRVDEIVD